MLCHAGTGESVRPVAAQQFNVLHLGGEHLYYGERWRENLAQGPHQFSYLLVVAVYSY